MEQIKNDNERKESGYFEGKRYDISKLYKYTENIPTEIVPLNEFESVISIENESWVGTDDNFIGPYNIVKDWDAAQKNPTWELHVESIKRVDLDVPILVSYTGHVIDGQHRIARSFIEGRDEIKVKRLPKELPSDLEM